MSHPDPGHPAEANGAYPSELPVHDSANTGTGTGIPGTGTGQAAQQIIKALALPTASGARVAPRPLSLSHLPRLPSETSMGYGIERVDPSGRVTSRRITDALRWRPGDRLAMTLTPSAVVLCPSPDGLLRVPRRPCIAIPVTARRLLSITPGNELLLAAAPEYRIVITHTMQAMEDMLVSFYAQIAADELPQP
jgi:hypothetical protein